MGFSKVLEAARSAAKKSNLKYKLGAVIFDRYDQIYSKGYNYNFTTSTTRHSTHAEESAIYKFLLKYPKTSLRRMNMLIWRGGNGGEARLAKPCIRCRELIRSVGIKNIYYSCGKYTSMGGEISSEVLKVR